jgi:hypothetical protein
MTSTDTAVEITRGNAYVMQDALIAQDGLLRAELDVAIDPAQRADIYRRAATNHELQALAWERRPGRVRNKRESVTRCRRDAQLLTAAADIEQLRASAAMRGRKLPDPRQLIAAIGDHMFITKDSAIAALIALYVAAAEPV